MAIKKLHQQLRSTVFVTHDQGEAMTLATKITGVIQQIGTPDDVYDLPETFRRRFRRLAPA